MKRYIALLVLIFLVFTISCNKKVNTDSAINDTKSSTENEITNDTGIDEDEVDISDENLKKPLIEDTEKPIIVDPVDVYKLDNTKIGWGLDIRPDGATPGIPDSWINLLKKYNGYYIGDTNTKEVYLTIDEGYEAGYTSKILDILKDNDVKVTFFITGSYLDTQKDLVLKMISEEHIIGNHTVSHPSMPTKSVEENIKELEDLNNKTYQETNYKMIYFRPPSGEFSERTLAVINSLGFKTIFWSIALRDWIPLEGGPEESYNTVINRLHNGAVILLHAVSKDDMLALDRIIKSIKEKGFEFKTLDQLVKK
jgi:peptidoglycan-N-acetylmuramic acid deacetylase